MLNICNTYYQHEDYPGETEPCPICLENTPTINATMCTHLLCRECASTLYTYKKSGSVCPICREGIDLEKAIEFPCVLDTPPETIMIRFERRNKTILEAFCGIWLFFITIGMPVYLLNHDQFHDK